MDVLDTLQNLLTFSLPGGFLGGVFTWIVSRRERNNDMLAKLQSSINLLSEENRKILAENVQLRRENANLQANQEEMLQKLGALTREVERLRENINSQNRKKKNESSNQRGYPHDGNTGGSADGGLLPGNERTGGVKLPAATGTAGGTAGRQLRRGVGRHSNHKLRNGDYEQDELYGADAAGAGIDGDPDSGAGEPP